MDVNSVHGMTHAGINPENAATLQGIPIAGVAAIRALGAAPDAAEAARALGRAIGAFA